MLYVLVTLHRVSPAGFPIAPFLMDTVDMTIPRLFAFVLPFVLGLVPAWAQNELKGLSGVNVGTESH